MSSPVPATLSCTLRDRLANETEASFIPQQWGGGMVRVVVGWCSCLCSRPPPPSQTESHVVFLSVIPTLTPPCSSGARRRPPLGTSLDSLWTSLDERAICCCIATTTATTTSCGGQSTLKSQNRIIMKPKRGVSSGHPNSLRDKKKVSSEEAEVRTPSRSRTVHRTRRELPFPDPRARLQTAHGAVVSDSEPTSPPKRMEIQTVLFF